MTEETPRNARRPRIRLLLALACTLPLTVPAAPEHVSTPTLESYDAWVGRWMDLRSAIAEEKSEWQAQRQQWRRELALLETEAERLRSQIAETKLQTASAEAERASAFSRRDALRITLGNIQPALDRVEMRLREWKAWIPPALSRDLEGLFDALPPQGEPADRRSIGARVQAVAALCAAIESLHNEVHLTREMMETENGPRQQVDVLYIGLGCAFAVAPHNDWAAVGRPGRLNWSWQPQPELAARIRDAIRIFNREKTARLVELPLSVLPETGP